MTRASVCLSLQRAGNALSDLSVLVLTRMPRKILQMAISLTISLFKACKKGEGAWDMPETRLGETDVCIKLYLPITPAEGGVQIGKSVCLIRLLKGQDFSFQKFGNC